MHELVVFFSIDSTHVVEFVNTIHRFIVNLRLRPNPISPPRDARYQDSDGNETPLYLACQFHPPPEAVRELMNAWRGAALTTSRVHRDLPLHIACRYNVSLDVLKELLLLSHRDSNCCNKDDVNDCGRSYYPSLDEDCDGFSDALGLAQIAGQITKWGTTPIHALWEGRDRSTTTAATATTDNNDEEESAFWKKILLLLQAIDACRKLEQQQQQRQQNQNTVGWTSRCDYCNVNEQMLVTTTRKKEDNSKTRTLLFLVHAAVSLGARGCPGAVLDYVLDRYPEQLRQLDQSGRLPLHVAVGACTLSGGRSTKEQQLRRSYRPREQEVISKLLRRYPQAAACQDSKNEPTGRFPLHTALIHGHSWEQGVKELAEASPLSVLTMRDPAFCIYPFQLAAASQYSDLNTIYQLLRAQPGALLLLQKDATSGEKKPRSGGNGKACSREPFLISPPFSLAGVLAILTAGLALSLFT